jgi:GTP-dependent phosphoenolpyruvate carboxykinase
LPNDYADETILQALKDAGIPIMGNYDPANMDETLQATLKGLTKGKNRFATPYMLGLTGLLGGGAILGNLLNNNRNVPN